jgi:hypothetical protein
MTPKRIDLAMECACEIGRFLGNFRSEPARREATRGELWQDRRYPSLFRSAPLH